MVVVAPVVATVIAAGKGCSKSAMVATVVDTDRNCSPGDDNEQYSLDPKSTNNI